MTRTHKQTCRQNDPLRAFWQRAKGILAGINDRRNASDVLKSQNGVFTGSVLAGGWVVLVLQSGISGRAACIDYLGGALPSNTHKRQILAFAFSILSTTACYQDGHF